METKQTYKPAPALDAEELAQQEAHAWESAHLPIILLAVIGLAGLATVMGCIFVLAPVWDIF